MVVSGTRAGNNWKPNMKKIETSRVKKVERYRVRATGPEGAGTGRSEGSNKRLKSLADRADCRKNKGKGCRKK